MGFAAVGRCFFPSDLEKNTIMAVNSGFLCLFSASFVFARQACGCRPGLLLESSLKKFFRLRIGFFHFVFKAVHEFSLEV